MLTATMADLADLRRREFSRLDATDLDRLVECVAALTAGPARVSLKAS
jgi:hypothetical protein